MADGTSAPEPAPRSARPIQRYGRIVVVGGGCYGGYYVRQLGRAWHAGALAWEELLVVDRDAACAVARLAESDRPPRLRLVHAEWRTFFDEFLGEAAREPSSHRAAIVPSPLMPHLMADWLIDRASVRWPDRVSVVEPLGELSGIPWQRAGSDGTRYVSFAEWICPINCIEPARCPETRGPRSWSLPVALRAGSAFAESESDSGSDAPLLFHCTHRAFGVGMIDVDDVVAADRAIAARAASGAASFIIGTVSHCHGALRRVTIAARERERPGSIVDFSW